MSILRQSSDGLAADGGLCRLQTVQHRLWSVQLATVRTQTAQRQCTGAADRRPVHAIARQDRKWSDRK